MAPCIITAARSSCAGAARAVVVLALLPVIAAAENLVLENRALRVEISGKTGCLTVSDKVSGRTWQPDPWENSAALVTLTAPDGRSTSADLSTSARIALQAGGAGEGRIIFTSPLLKEGLRLQGLEARTRVVLEGDEPELHVRVEKVDVPPGYRAHDLEYPRRQFHLRTGVERGMGVIPFVQGAVVPSYMYPMPVSKFGRWDDAMYAESTAIGELRVYGQLGLQMPWFGLQAQTSGVMALLPTTGTVRLKYILNYNDKTRINREQGKESSYPRILSLYPVWSLEQHDPGQSVTFRLLAKGTYVSMAKHYRAIAKSKGLFVSLREKAKKAPGVLAMAGDVNLHVYGGYPHHLNFPGMAFTFRQLRSLIEDLHDSLKVRKAFLTVWGTWENYPPFHWPVNTKAGGLEELRRTFDLAKSYGYLITPYHNWSAMLEQDPLYDRSLLPKDRDGTPVVRSGRWGTIDRKYSQQMAQTVLEKEFAAIGSNATYSDVGQSEGLRHYLGGLGIPAVQERMGDSELSVPMFHRFEGMAPHNTKHHMLPFVEAPLFNLVYHDAVMTSNRWQSPDNDYDINGDYAVRSLRNMLYGNSTMFVVAPYEYGGVRDYIRNAVAVMAPVHEETAFEELLRHEYLSSDMTVQRSEFSTGVVVTVNLGLAEQLLADGSRMPGYGFRVLHANGDVTTGTFRITMQASKRSLSTEKEGPRPSR